MDINRLYDYEVDHIIPQSYIKDDSIDNLALVIKRENQNKSDNMLLAPAIINSQRARWQQLYQSGLISKKKLDNLTRYNFDEKELKGFIARQLVETRQITKHVAQLLTAYHQESTIVTVKAELISNLRKQQHFYKLRDVNDLHHAHDGYLAIVVGNFIRRRFPHLESEFNYGDYLKFANGSKAGKNKYGYVIGSMNNDYIDPETGELIWASQHEMSKIRQALAYHDCFISRKLEENTGKFYDQTIYPKGKGNIPLKKDLDPEKYGGYSGKKDAYMVVIAYQDKKGKEGKALIGIPITVAKLAQADAQAVLTYCQKYCQDEGYTNPIIIKEKILKYQQVCTKGDYFYLASCSEWHNAKQFILAEQFQPLLYALSTNNLKDIEDGQLDQCYLYFCDKLQAQYAIFGGICTKLIAQYEDFQKLDFEQKAAFLLELFKITTAKAINANLGKYKIKDLSDRMGRLAGKTIDVNQTIFIDRSITGMFERRYQL